MYQLSEKFLTSRLGVGKAPGATDDDLLGTGDPAVRRRWQFGLTLAAGCIAFAFFARWLSLGAGIITGDTVDLYLFAIVLNSLVWVTAVWLITPREIDHHWPVLLYVRWTVRVTQMFWPFALGIYAYARIAPMAQTTEDRLLVQQFIMRAVAGFGVIALAWMLHVVAWGAQKERASRRMLVAAWLMPIFAALGQAFPDRMAWFEIVILAMILFFWTWTMWLFTLGLWELAVHAGWSIRQLHQQASRDQRITEKRQEMDEEVSERVRPVSPDRGREIPLDSQE